MRHVFQRAVPILLLLLITAGGAGPGCDLQHAGAPDAPAVLPPTPPPTPAPPVVVFGCGLPRGTGDGRNCGFENTVFEARCRRPSETMRSTPSGSRAKRRWRSAATWTDGGQPAPHGLCALNVRGGREERATSTAVDIISSRGPSSDLPPPAGRGPILAGTTPRPSNLRAMLLRRRGGRGIRPRGGEHCGLESSVATARRLSRRCCCWPPAVSTRKSPHRLRDRPTIWTSAG
jgi:hypothetical protein